MVDAGVVTDAFAAYLARFLIRYDQLAKRSPKRRIKRRKRDHPVNAMKSPTQSKRVKEAKRVDIMMVAIEEHAATEEDATVEETVATEEPAHEQERPSQSDRTLHSYFTKQKLEEKI